MTPNLKPLVTLRVSDKERKRFFDNTMPEPNTGCWLWTSYLSGCGYASITINKRVMNASRVSYSMLKGEIPKGLYVLHTCDNRLCVNPDHLFLGTQKENIIDMHKKGRGRVNFGQRSSTAKLSDKDAKDIVKMSGNGISDSEIAEKYDVTVGTIYRIRSGNGWNKVTGLPKPIRK